MSLASPESDRVIFGKDVRKSFLARKRTLAGWRALWRDRACGRTYPRQIVDAIPTHLTPPEKQLLYRIAYALPDGAQIAEIGSYLGASACCLAAGVADSGKQSTVHCIDTFMNDAVSDARKDVSGAFQANTQLFTAQIVVHRGFSQDVVGELSPGVDLLFIDGDHAWAAVVRDLVHYVPLLRDDGILVMHDVGWGACETILEQFVLAAETHRLARYMNIYAGQVRAGALVGALRAAS